MNRDFMQEAIRLAERGMSTRKGGPFGAVVVQGERIIGRGWNAVISRNDPTAHAEIMAIRAACKSLRAFTLSQCVIYTSCERCPMCLGAICWARIQRIYYANNRQDAAAIGFDDATFYQELSLPLTQRKIPMKQLLRAKALAVFEAWRKKPDKVQY
jgi:guanine deaminase